MEILRLSDWLPINKNKPLVIAGPCSAESQEQVLKTADCIKKICPDSVKIFRAGIWKPRTRPGNFQGLGNIALPWLKLVKEKYNFLTAIEVATSYHVETALKNNVDILWLGARTTVNPFAVSEIANALKGVDIPIMIKNPINPDLSLWIGAIERITKKGINKVVAIHRGFSTFNSSDYRNNPLWEIPLELKRKYPLLPIICDASHIVGKREGIDMICQWAIDLNMDGLMIETHINPKEALSDSKQQVTPKELQNILENILYKKNTSTNKNYLENLEDFREKIDTIDRRIISLLKDRVDIVRKIGNLKRENNITPFQEKRMNELLNNCQEIANENHISPNYIKQIYSIIHAESVKNQSQKYN